jgi:class 3 adenylate cyclase
MTNNAKHTAAFVMALDIKGFSQLKPKVQLDIVDYLYPELARLVNVCDRKKLLDRKTIGDGFMFYFASAADAVQAAITIRMLFREERFWTEHHFETPLKCRIGLHFGQFFWKRDVIEDRDALFGRNIITVARLEPVVAANEIWCTHSFKAEAGQNEILDRVRFENLGECQLAKGWSKESVYGIYLEDESPPKPIRTGLDIYEHENSDKEYPYTYFALIRLRNRTEGVRHLENYLSDKGKFRIEAVYDILGDFDIILRFKAGKEWDQEKFAKHLKGEKITRHNGDCYLTQIQFEGGETLEKVIMLSEPRTHIKAFAYIRSHSIVKNREKLMKVVDLARKACGKETGVVTYYKNSDVLILPIVIPVEHYYALADAIENIEKWVDNQGVPYDSIITYLAHGFREYFINPITK